MANPAILSSAPWPAPAKINLFLHIVGRRPDGYHLLQTHFQFLDHGDDLRFGLREDGAIDVTYSWKKTFEESEERSIGARARPVEARLSRTDRGLSGTLILDLGAGG